MFEIIFTFLYWYLRPMIKWFLRHTTRLCELQRICYGQQQGAPRTLAVEFSLENSRSYFIQELVLQMDQVSEHLEFVKDNKQAMITQCVVTVLQVKKIKPTVHPQFVQNFGRCVEQIWGYKQLYTEIEILRTTQYDSENADHEMKLLELWSKLMPNEPLESRVTKQWQDIGFQGDDPKTDFRGMGMLGLENLLYFATEYEGPARHVLSHSYHPVHGYAFAIVGINLTSMAYNLLRDGAAKTHIYNVTRSMPTLKTFHQLYCYLFYEFDRYWIASKPQNMMDFSMIREKFEKNILASLANQSTVFRVNIQVDTV